MPACSEFLGFQQREVFKVVRPEPGVRIHDTLTRLEYKEDNGEFLKCKVRLCARGDQQISGVSFQESDLYALNLNFLKTTEARLLLALAAANGAKVVKTDTKQAYLYGDMGDDVVYIRPPDWWPEPVAAGSGRTRIPPTQEHLRDATSGSQMAHAHLNMDGEEWIFGREQREDYQTLSS